MSNIDTYLSEKIQKLGMRGVQKARARAALAGVSICDCIDGKLTQVNK